VWDIAVIHLQTNDANNQYFLHVSMMNGAPSLCLEQLGSSQPWECYSDRKYPFQLNQAVHLMFTFDVTRSGAQKYALYADGRLWRPSNLLWTVDLRFSGGGNTALLFPITNSSRRSTTFKLDT